MASAQQNPESPKVSILIPCYNAEKWVAEAIESALEQDYPNKEVIVVDDGSTDRSTEIIREYATRITWETGPNRGGNPARNRLLELSKGEWLQYLDADDALLTNKIREQMNVVKKTPKCDLLFGPSIFLFHENDSKRQEIHNISDPDDPWVLLARWDLPQTGSPLWRKQAILDVGGWKDDQPCCQEHELYTRLLCAGKTFVYNEASGSIYRQWSDETVCKKDVSKVHLQKIYIFDRALEFLRDTDSLTPERTHAFCQGIFQTARSVWQYDKARANKLIKKIRALDKTFIPAGDAAPESYRKAYKCFGFAAAERIAQSLRPFKKPLAT